MPTALAALIALFAVQIAFGRDQPHVPGKIARRGVDGGTLTKATETLRPLARRLDGIFQGRLERLTRRPMRRIAMGVVLALCSMVPPLELVPFASTLPMGAILLFGIAHLFRDGLVMLVAMLAAVGAVGGVLWILL